MSINWQFQTQRSDGGPHYSQLCHVPNFSFLGPIVLFLFVVVFCLFFVSHNQQSREDWGMGAPRLEGGQNIHGYTRVEAENEHAL